MCDALMEIMREEWKDELDKVRVAAKNEALVTGHQEGLMEGRKEGLAEGRKEGLAEGRKEGLAEGRQEGLAEGRQEGLMEGLTEGIKALISACRALGASKEDTALQLMNGFSMDQESAQANISKYW